MRKIIIGTRGSVLAKAQAVYVKKRLEENYPEFTFEIKEIVATGDKDLKSNWENSDKSLKGLFTKEIENELLFGDIDFAVHSMKDMPSENPEGLICGAIPTREDKRDVLISKNNLSLKDLPAGSTVGTSSLRRTMNLKNLRPDLEVKHLRGNIHTRLKKFDNGDYDAILLAAAGLHRVGLKYRISEYLDEHIFLPAPGQGALCIQCRKNDKFILEILSSIHDKEAEELVLIEREFSRIFDGGCHTPMGCLAEKDEDIIRFKAILYNENKKIEASVARNILEKKNIGIEIAKEAAAIIKGKMNE